MRFFCHYKFLRELAFPFSFFSLQRFFVLHRHCLLLHSSRLSSSFFFSSFRLFCVHMASHHLGDDDEAASRSASSDDSPHDRRNPMPLFPFCNKQNSTAAGSVTGPFPQRVSQGICTRCKIFALCAHNLLPLAPR